MRLLIMKTIATFEKPEEAHLVRMRLEASGIQAYLQDENITQLGTWRAHAMGGVRLQVADEDVEAARNFLVEDSKCFSAADSSKETDSIQCCSCGATISSGQTRCSACGWSYEDNGEEREENS